MAAYNKYDPRLESLVVETKTFWDDSVSDLSEEDRETVAQAIHAAAHLADKVNYERAHTGFTREVTVNADTIQKLYQENLQAQ
ncbi:hypothetical protein OAK47_00030 [Planctomycetaceae bacterium]|jgi:hypothetical protein|nr:hypothetical protein [Planctomycetaceae bacterium]MDC0308079.1 hypothetical protein [Planctomycetaceae bacterium]MDG2391239.1 hypothetical protein [Planctomycetaceae bacterium]